MTNIDFIKKGKNTSDATATANDIINPKTAYVNNEKITGNIMPTYVSNATSILTDNTLLTTNFETFTISCVLTKHNKVISVQDSKVNIYNISSDNLELNKSIDISDLNLASTYTKVWCSNYDSINKLYYIIFTQNTNSTNVKIYKYLVESNEIISTNIPETSIGSGDRGGISLIASSPLDSNIFLIYTGAKNGKNYAACFAVKINNTILDINQLYLYDNMSNTRISSFSWNNNNVIAHKTYYNYKVFLLNTTSFTITDISMFNNYNTILISQDGNKAISILDNVYYYSDISISNNAISLSNIKQIPSNLTPCLFTNCNDIFICLNSNNKFLYITYNKLTNSFQTSYTANNTNLSYKDLQGITNQSNFILSSDYSNNLEFNNANQITSIKTEINTAGQELVIMKRNNVDFYNTYNADVSGSNILENKIAYGANGKITGIMPNNGELNYTPSTQSQSIPAGYTSGGTIAAVTSSIDSNIQAGNIKSGVSILGISGTYEGSGVTPDTTIANGDYGLESMTSGEGNNDIGYKFFANANTQSKLYEVGSIVEVHITNELLAQVLGITADKIKSGEVICGIEGTYTGEMEV